MRGQRVAKERTSPVKTVSHDAYYTIGVVLVLLAGICGGIASTAGKYAANFQVDVTTVNLVRYVVSTAVLWLVLPLMGRSIASAAPPGDRVCAGRPGTGPGRRATGTSAPYTTCRPAR